MMRCMQWISSTHPRSQNHISLASNWNLIVFVIGMFSFCLDPFLLYLPKSCGLASLCMDVKLGAIIAILRTLGDVSFLCSKSLLLNISPPFDTSRRDAPVEEPRDTFRNYLKSAFLIDLAAIIPLPQIFIWHKIHSSDASMSSGTSGSISQLFTVQFCLRAFAMFPVSKNVYKMIGKVMRNAWSGALLNLMYFMVISHIWGALYYEMYVSRLLKCKHMLSKMQVESAKLDWDQLLAVCSQNDKFEIGMFSDAFTTKIVTRNFVQKFVYCLSWGLKSLSSFGQIFSASSWPVETFFSFLTVVFGLILFGDLLARMQSGLQSTEMKEDRQRTRQRMVEDWMNYHQLPQGLKKQIKQAVQSEWFAGRGMNDDSILNSLPWDVKREVRRHLYLDVIQDLPPFAEMDNHLVIEICGHLRTFSSNLGYCIAVQGEPIREMIFIFSGELEVACSNSVTLGPGDICGKELLQWCSVPNKSTEDLPCSTATVKCLTDVDAFALAADDVKLLAIQFHRHGKFRQAFQRFAV